MNDKLKILSIDDKSTGCYWYRTKIPMMGLKARGHEIELINGQKNEVDFKKYNIFSLNRTYSGNIAEPIRVARNNNLKIVYDCDDAIDLIPEHNPARGQVETQLGNYFYLLRSCDLITTTTENLKKHFQKYTDKPIHVFPNCVEKSEWEERTRTHGLRIGFAGSDTHIKDIMIVLPVIRELQKKYNFEFFIFGFSSSETLADHILSRRKQYEKTKFFNVIKLIDDFENIIKQLKNVRWVPFAPITLYSRILSSLDLDIGLCPLEKDSFNENKSCIKFYEYSMAGTLTIASDLLPYSEEPLVLVENNYHEKWYEAIENAIKDRSGNVEKQQKEWVTENRTIDSWIGKREKLYKGLL